MFGREDENGPASVGGAGGNASILGAGSHFNGNTTPGASDVATCPSYVGMDECVSCYDPEPEHLSVSPRMKTVRENI